MNNLLQHFNIPDVNVKQRKYINYYRAYNNLYYVPINIITMSRNAGYLL